MGNQIAAIYPLDLTAFLVYSSIEMKKLAAYSIWSHLIILSLVLTTCVSQPVPAEDEILPIEEDLVQESEEEEEDMGPPEELVLYPEGAELPVSSFREIWAYLVAGREQSLRSSLPISDIGYFGAEVNIYGQLVNVPDRRRLSSYRGRVHLVAVSSGNALTHFVLMEGSRERRQLIEDLLRAAEPFDGLQIDFENVPARDGAAFLSFLRELRAGLKDKMFTIALSARTRTLQSDVYDYRQILPIVDRILVMGYDEHWSGSAPGPIASMGWSQRVAAYSLETIGRDKLIMGLPFYGRSWGNLSVNLAYIYSTVERVHRENGSPEIRREDGIPNFRYQTQVTATVFYEDVYSLSARLEMYKRMGVAAVGFWSLSQETPAIWQHLELAN